MINHNGTELIQRRSSGGGSSSSTVFASNLSMISNDYLDPLPGLPSMFANKFPACKKASAYCSIVIGSNSSFIPFIKWAPAFFHDGEVQWSMEYSIESATHELSSSTIITATQISQGIGDNGFPIAQSLDFPAITAKPVGSLLMLTISRDPALDTYYGATILFSVGIRYF